MVKKKELLLEVGDGDIKMLRTALVSAYTKEPSPLRVFAAAKFGGRSIWATIVQEWDRMEKSTGKKFSMLRIYSDGSGSVELKDKEAAS